LAQLGTAILYKTDCFKNCYELRGHIAQFIRHCCAGPIIQPAYNKKQKATGKIIQIDKNSSYPSVYRDFLGIPAGPPSIIEQFKPDELEYYCILIDVKSFKCKHNRDPFPLLSRCGEHYLDKVIFEQIQKHYDITYKFITGISFNSFNTNIKAVSERLYAIRQKYNNTPIKMLIKSLMNSLWGKSIQKARGVYEIEILENKIENFKKYNFDFLYSIKKEKTGDYKAQLIQSLSLKYSLPQFACNVLSYSKKTMTDLIYSTIDLGGEIFYIHTDCLTMRKDDFNKLNEKYNLLGTEMGKFKIEVESVEFMAIAPYKNLHVLPDGTARVRYPTHLNNAIDFFEKCFSP
jgi:hypothetical protein